MWHAKETWYGYKQQFELNIKAIVGRKIKNENGLVLWYEVLFRGKGCPVVTYKIWLWENTEPFTSHGHCKGT